MAEGNIGHENKSEDRTKLAAVTKTPSPGKSYSLIADPSIQRKIRDIIIDLHECVQNWEQVNQSSFQSINSLVNLSSQKKSSEEEYERDPSSVSSECWKKYNVKILDLRESLISDHIGDMKKIKLIYQKVKKAVNNLESIYYMKLSSSSLEGTEENDNERAVFNTWSCEKFYRAARSIFNSYTKEWLLKQQMSEHFLGINSKTEQSQTSLFVSMWLHQPYIDESCSSTLESMLHESGIK